MKRNTLLTSALLVLITFFSSCEKEGRLDIIIQPTYQGENLALRQNVTLNGHPLKLELFNLYAGNLQVGDQSLEDIALLTMPNNTTLSYSLEPGTYNDLSFAIGVPFDLNNANPATYDEDHPLSVTNNMHWPMGNYIFTKIEGFYKDSLPFLYHVGLDTFYTPLTFNQAIVIEDGKTTTATLAIDFYDVFAGQAETIDPEAEFDTHTMNDVPLAAKVMRNLAASTSLTIE